MDAKSWFDLQERVKFTSYSGGKSRLENLAFLPTTVMSFINQSIPVFAQWNYRIVCHPLSVDIPTSHFEVVDEFSTRMRHRRTIQQILHSRAARFNLKTSIPGLKRKPSKYSFLDLIMSEIPGKDNYLGKLAKNMTSPIHPCHEYKEIMPPYLTLNRLRCSFHHCHFRPFFCNSSKLSDYVTIISKKVGLLFDHSSDTLTLSMM